MQELGAGAGFGPRLLVRRRDGTGRAALPARGGDPPCARGASAPGAAARAAGGRRDRLLDERHDLGFQQCAGRGLRSGAMWRGRWLGGSRKLQLRRLPPVAHNTRFLKLDAGTTCAHLGSSKLGPTCAGSERTGSRSGARPGAGRDVRGLEPLPSAAVLGTSGSAGVTGAAGGSAKPAPETGAGCGFALADAG